MLHISKNHCNQLKEVLLVVVVCMTHTLKVLTYSDIASY